MYLDQNCWATDLEMNTAPAPLCAQATHNLCEPVSKIV